MTELEDSSTVHSCPTCGKELNTDLGLKQHHTKVHGESLVETKDCEICGETFKVRPSHDNRNTCSYECKGELRSKRGVPARKRQVEKTCPVCGDDFSVKQSRSDVRVHCSQKCYHNSGDGKDVKCEWCGDEFYAYDSYADDARFCSQDCYGEWLSARRSGSNSWNWKGDDRFEERPPYGPGWGMVKRRTVRERDGRECAGCGMDESDHLDEYGCKLHVHHQVDPRRSINPAIHNAPRNLQTLCIGCHLSITHSNS